MGRLGAAWRWSGRARTASAAWWHHGRNSASPAGLFLANLAVLAFSAWSGDQFVVWGWRIPFALSIILVGIGLWIRLGILETPVFQQLLDTNKIEKAPISEVIKKQPKEIILSALAAAVRAGAVLHLHRLHLRLRGRHAAHVAGPDSLRGAGGGLRLLHYHPALRPHLRPHRAQEECI